MQDNITANKKVLRISYLIIVLFIIITSTIAITFIILNDKKEDAPKENVELNNIESNNDDISIIYNTSKKMIDYMMNSEIINNKVEVDSITISGDKEVFVGNKITLKADINPSDAINKEIIWTSSNSTIASVDQNGNVTGLKSGSVDIIVSTKTGNIKVNYKVDVKDMSISKIEMSSSYRNIELIINKTFDIKSVLTIYPKDANIKELEFNSSNTNVATVTNDGIIKALKPGNSSITIKVPSGANVIIHLRVIENNEIKLDNISTNANKVMIVAHPDDETLWGSHGLYHDKYLVVCVTCGQVKERVDEFSNVMKVTGDDYIMLNYPDLVNGKKSEWKDEYKNIEKDIRKILSSKNWDIIVTHNPDGEYNHIHHKMTSKIVTDNANHNRLSYFGRFYWDEIPNEDKLYRLTDDEFEFKTKKLIPIYGTQESAIRNLKNMVHYESWITYDEWYNVEESTE